MNINEWLILNELKKKDGKLDIKFFGSWDNAVDARNFLLMWNFIERKQNGIYNITWKGLWRLFLENKMRDSI
jgi:hypothetical protein